MENPHINNFIINIMMLLSIVIGTHYFPYLRAYTKNKLDQRSMVSVFMGYATK